MLSLEALAHSLSTSSHSYKPLFTVLHTALYTALFIQHLFPTLATLLYKEDASSLLLYIRASLLPLHPFLYSYVNLIS